MTERPNLLVVCGKNKRRSRTAEYIFKNDQRFSIRSVGLSPKSERKLTEKDILWADMILVMEDSQASRINKDYRNTEKPPVLSLDIPDVYEYLDEELVELLDAKINDAVKSEWNLD